MLLWLLLSACTCSSPDAPVVVEHVEEDFDPDDPEQGLFQKARVDEEIAALEALGYVDGAEPAPARSGVTIHAPDVAPARLLWTSGHAPEAYLMERDGTVLHTWRKTYEELFADKLHGEGRGRSYWRRVHLFDDGSLLAVFEAQGLVKLDRDSNVVWRLHEAVHHDVKIGGDGVITTLTRKALVKPRVNPRRPILEDHIARIAPDGTVLKEVSVVDALLDSEFASVWTQRKNHGDLFHTNAVVVLDGRWADRLPSWTAGRVLISLRALHALLVVDLEEEKVVWAGTGSWRRQHDPRLLDDTLLLFDNLGGGSNGTPASRVLELDPVSLEPVWVYEGSDAAPFFSRFCGAAERFADGTTMVSDSWVGRAFEVDREGRILWEFVNPHRAGDDDAFIAVIPEMLRLPPTTGTSWLDAQPDGDGG